MKVTAISYQSLAGQQPLHWPPVVPTERCDPQACDFHWRRLQCLFPDIEDPRTFPPFAAGRFSPTELEVLRRFREQAVHLAESRVVNEGASVSVRFPDGHGREPQVDHTFPAQDAIAGFSVLFRQCYSSDERASFSKTRNILWKATMAAAGDAGAERAAHLTAWARAQGQLRAYDLMTLCGNALRPGRPRGLGLPDRARTGDPPEFIISAFNYGADIHWGDRRDTVALWNNDAFMGPHQRMRFFESAVSLAFVYIGMSELIHAALP